MKKTVASVVARPGEDPKIEQIGTELEDWQTLVGEGVGASGTNYVESWHFGGRIQLICNDNRQDLPPNRFSPKHGAIFGTFFLSRADEEGEAADLEPSELEAAIAEIKKWPMAVPRERGPVL